MKVSPFAGKPAEPSMLVNVPRLVTAYYTETPDPSVPEQRVAFGTSGHRGSAFDKAFNEWHTARIIPHCAGVAVPLEVDPILWQR